MGFYEWDPVKALYNELRRGISFDEAETVFLDRWRLMMPDDRHSTDKEARMITIGWSGRGRLLGVITSWEDGRRPRIISARRATKRERDEYVRRRR